jgi:hypothetical protein
VRHGAQQLQPVVRLLRQGHGSEGGAAQLVASTVQGQCLAAGATGWWRLAGDWNDRIFMQPLYVIQRRRVGGVREARVEVASAVGAMSVEVASAVDGCGVLEPPVGGVRVWGTNELLQYHHRSKWPASRAGL